MNKGLPSTDQLLGIRHSFGEPLWAQHEHLKHAFWQSRIVAMTTPRLSRYDAGHDVEFEMDWGETSAEYGDIIQEEYAISGLYTLYNQLYFLDRAAAAIPRVDYIAPVVAAIERAVEALAPDQDFQPFLRTM